MKNTSMALALLSILSINSVSSSEKDYKWTNAVNFINPELYVEAVDADHKARSKYIQEQFGISDEDLAKGRECPETQANDLERVILGYGSMRAGLIDAVCVVADKEVGELYYQLRLAEAHNINTGVNKSEDNLALIKDLLNRVQVCAEFRKKESEKNNN